MRFINLIISLFFGSLLFAQEAVTSSNTTNLGSLLEPDPVHFSFEAPGWYFLAGAVFIVLIVFFVMWMKNYHKNAYRRDALKKLATLEADNTSQNYLSDILALLKIVAINAYGRTEVATLYGTAWLRFLDSKGKNFSFSGFENIIGDSVYRGKTIDNLKLKEISILTKKWIKTHA